MRTSKFAALALLSSILSGCVTASHAPIAEGATLAKVSQMGSPISSELLNLNEKRTSMNVEGGFIRDVSQEFSGKLNFQMRMMEEHAVTKWSPVVGVCLKEPSSEASACMQFLRISEMGTDFRAMFYYLANKQAPRQHKQILVDHKAVLGQAIDITIRQNSEQLVFTINGKDEIFPISFKARILEYHCSSAVCEFRDWPADSG